MGEKETRITGCSIATAAHFCETGSPGGVPIVIAQSISTLDTRWLVHSVEIMGVQSLPHQEGDSGQVQDIDTADAL
jgi:hypothetical protein